MPEQQFRTYLGARRDAVLEPFYEIFYHALPSRVSCDIIQDALTRYAGYRGNPSHRRELETAVRGLFVQGIDHLMSRYAHSVSGQNEYHTIVDCLWYTSTSRNPEILYNLDPQKTMSDIMQGLARNDWRGANIRNKEGIVILAKAAASYRRFSQAFRDAFAALPADKQSSVRTTAAIMKSRGSELAADNDVLDLIGVILPERLPARPSRSRRPDSGAATTAPAG